MKLSLSILFLAASSLSASPILTYSFSGTATGTLGGNNFANSAFTVSATADAAAVSCVVGTCRMNLLGGAAAFTLAGVGSGVFNGETYFFNNQVNRIAGFGDSTAPVACCDIIQTPALAALSTYGLNTAFGPVGPFALNPSVGDWINLNTSLGAFTVTSLTNYTFLVTEVTVPEPSSILLVACGLGLATLRKLRQRT